MMVSCGGGGGGGRCLESMVGNASCTMGVKVRLVEVDSGQVSQHWCHPIEYKDEVVRVLRRWWWRWIPCDCACWSPVLVSVKRSCFLL